MTLTGNEYFALKTVGNMIAKAKGYSVYGLAAGLAAAAFCMAAPASAFVVDGIVTGADNYTSTYNIGFKYDGSGGGTDTGQLRIGRDGTMGDVFLHWTVPTSLVDNIYGPDSFIKDGGCVNQCEWGGIKHNFKKLTGSDKLEFKIDTKDGPAEKYIRIDYAKNDGDPDGNGSDSGILSSTMPSFATSLELNLSKSNAGNSYAYGTNKAITGDENTAQSPDPTLAPADWEQAIQYEIRLDGTQFADGFIPDAANISMAVLHASNNKHDAGNVVEMPCLGLGGVDGCVTVEDETPGIPEPASGALFLGGLGLVSLCRRRRKAA